MWKLLLKFHKINRLIYIIINNIIIKIINLNIRLININIKLIQYWNWFNLI